MLGRSLNNEFRLWTEKTLHQVVLESEDPSLRYLTITGVLGEPTDSKEAGAAAWKKRILSSVEVADWRRQGPNKMITLNALRVLKGTGRVNST